MKITLIYLHVAKSGYPEAPPPEYYWRYSERWARTYQQHPAGIEHEVRIVCCGGPPTDAIVELYAGIPHTWESYLGAGSDIGACQYAMKHVDADFVVCMSTPVYLWKPGWLKRMADVREYFGDGLYGPMASNQNTPHIRTSCWGVDPKTFEKYPHVIDTREKACWAESFDYKDERWQISNWYESIPKPVIMMTWNGVHNRSDWRKPANIFRRGDQSACLVWDQHVDKYFAAHYHERLAFEKLADEDCTVIPANPEKV